MREPIAKWNESRDCWERPGSGLLSEPSDVYWETLPPSGMTHGGWAFELPMSALPTVGIASSLLLKTPTSQLAVNGGSQHPDKRRAGGHGPTLADEVEHLLPTPIVSDGTGGPKDLDGARFAPQLREITQLLPTPQAHDAQGGKTPEQVAAMRARGHGVRNLNEVAANELSGASTSPPSVAGNPSSDALHPLQLEGMEGLGRTA